MHYFLSKIKNRNLVYPYCGTPSNRCHSKYKKSFNDLPIDGKKVIIEYKCQYNFGSFQCWLKSLNYTHH